VKGRNSIGNSLMGITEMWPYSNVTSTILAD
jgi:hypothetical protein